MCVEACGGGVEVCVCVCRWVCVQADENQTGVKDWQSGREFSVEEPEVTYPLVQDNLSTHKVQYIYISG